MTRPEIPVLPHFLARPALDLAPHRAALADLHAEAASRGALPDRPLPVPTWQYLCWLADEGGVLLHGTGADVERLEPRRANDVNEFGARDAVYAASDGIWPIFFAILDRPNVPMAISNAAIRLEVPGVGIGEPLYFFSISADAHARRPYRPGRVYVLPRDGFEEEAPREARGMRVHLHHWAGAGGVRPLYAVPVTPEDFPFLPDIRAHDDAELWRRAEADPEGFPWVD